MKKYCCRQLRFPGLGQPLKNWGITISESKMPRMGELKNDIKNEDFIDLTCHKYTVISFGEFITNHFNLTMSYPVCNVNC